VLDIVGASEAAVRHLRMQHGIHVWLKQIDTLAGELPAIGVNYLYTTYSATAHDSIDSNATRRDRSSVVVLGSGPYRIGSSVEFDWSVVEFVRSVAACRESRTIQTAIINCNPETVSTDFDESDRLYLEELTVERVLDICALEGVRLRGVVACFGGQVSNNLALQLATHQVPLIGTEASMIERAENRASFSAIMDQLHIAQPHWQSIEKHQSVEMLPIQYPCLMRPSYVLSGSRMRVCHDESINRQHSAARGIY
jgi:carbamoylphosphate synthase large subunit